MVREAKSKYNLMALSAGFLVAFGFNAVFVYLAAHASLSQKAFPTVAESMPIGIKWLVLLGAGLLSVGLSYWVHRHFLEGGISPVDTTWADFVIIAYALLTFITLLFLNETFWLFFAVILVLLFLFTVFVTKRLLNNTGRWAAWLVSTLLLTALAVIFTATMVA